MKNKSSQRGCIGFLSFLFNERAGGSGSLPLVYRKKKYLFTKAEKSFYLVLQQVVPQGYVLFAKVRLADAVEVPPGTEGYMRLFNRISSKHLDYLICDEKWLEPRVAIELDDASHGSAKRIERDAFLNTTCEKAGLPLLRVKAARSYDTAALRSEIARLL